MRKIKAIKKKVSFAQAEEDDIIFWANKTIKERLEEAMRLKIKIWTHRLGYYPTKMERVVKKVSIKNQ